MTDRIYTSNVKVIDDEYYIDLPQDLLDSLGWKEGDTLLWYIDEHGGVFIKKKD